MFLLLSSYAGIDETVELVRAIGGTCVGYIVDISKKEDVYKAADTIRRNIGHVSSIFIPNGLLFIELTSECTVDRATCYANISMVCSLRIRIACEMGKI